MCWVSPESDDVLPASSLCITLLQLFFCLHFWVCRCYRNLAGILTALTDLLAMQLTAQAGCDHYRCPYSIRYFLYTVLSTLGQICSVRHRLNWSGKLSAMLQLKHKIVVFTVVICTQKSGYQVAKLLNRVVHCRIALIISFTMIPHRFKCCQYRYCFIAKMKQTLR